MTARCVIYGSRTAEVELVTDYKERADVAIYVAEMGFSHFDAGERDSWPSGDYADLKRLTDAMREAGDGLLIAFVDRPGPRRLILVQDDRGKFYEGRQTREDVAWRDFYFAAGYAALDWADWLWKPKVVELACLSGGPEMPSGAGVAFFEGVGHLVDQRELALERVLVAPVAAGEVERAAEVLNAERARENPPAFRPLEVRPWDVSHIGLRLTEGIRLLRVEVRGAAVGTA